MIVVQCVDRIRSGLYGARDPLPLVSYQSPVDASILELPQLVPQPQAVASFKVVQVDPRLGIRRDVILAANLAGLLTIGSTF